MRSIVLLLLALAAPGLAQPADPMPPSQARWDIKEMNGPRYLRATSDDGRGGGKLMFLCNQTGQLVVMAMLLDPAAENIAAATGSVGFVLDGAVEPAGGQPQAIVMNQAVMSLFAVDSDRFRRMAAGQAAGIVWQGADGARLAGFQIALASGRARLASFARQCSAQNYP